MLKIENSAKACLCAVNASFTHTSLAQLRLLSVCRDLSLCAKTYSINDAVSRVCGELYALDCQMYLFGVYIWNLPFIEQLARRLKSLRPDCVIVCGGPEVSYDTQRFMQEHPFVDIVLRGEGEESVPMLLQGVLPDKIPGACYRAEEIVIQPLAIVPDLDALPPVYDKEILSKLQHKMLYYETSRGCPFRCSYCLSSTAHGVRYFSLERVKNDFKLFMDAKVPLVKLTDRTFNMQPKRTAELLRFILEHNQCTCFHFEISADILDEEVLSILETAPKDTFQLEIGVQTTNEKASDAIDRSADFAKISANVARLKKAGNMHLHLDLIAGLPYEDYNSFGKSFNDVFALRPDMLQLGFLKLLKGTKIRGQAAQFNYISTEEPPYEVLSTAWLDYTEMLRLKDIEPVLEIYYNSGAFSKALECSLAKSGLSPFAYFEKLAQYRKNNTIPGAMVSQSKNYDLFYSFHTQCIAPDDGAFNAYLCYEQLKHNKTAQAGAWARLPTATKAFYDAAWQTVRDSGILSDVQLGLKQKELLQHVRIVRFSYDVLAQRQQDSILVFDYKNKNTYSLAVENDEENNV